MPAQQAKSSDGKKGNATIKYGRGQVKSAAPALAAGPASKIQKEDKSSPPKSFADKIDKTKSMPTGPLTPAQPQTPVESVRLQGAVSPKSAAKLEVLKIQSDPERPSQVTIVTPAAAARAAAARAAPAQTDPAPAVVEDNDDPPPLKVVERKEEPVSAQEVALTEVERAEPQRPELVLNPSLNQIVMQLTQSVRQLEQWSLSNGGSQGVQSPPSPSSGGPAVHAAQVHQATVATVKISGHEKPSVRQNGLGRNANARLKNFNDFDEDPESFAKPLRGVNLQEHRRRSVLAKEARKKVPVQMEEIWFEKVAEDPAEIATTARGNLRRLSSTGFFGGITSSGDSHLGAPSPMLKAKKHSNDRFYDSLKDTDQGWLGSFVTVPSSKFRLVWEVVAIILLGWDVFWVPFQTYQPKDTLVTRTLELMSLGYWTFDIAASFMVGYYRQDGVLTMRLDEISINYLRTWFFYDVSCIIMDWVIYIWLWNIFGGNSYKLARLLRMFRFLKLNKRIKATMKRFTSPYQIIFIEICKSLAVVIVLQHLTACAWHACGTYYTKSSSGRWTDAADLPNRSIGYQYLTSLQWAITQLGVGAVEVVPVNSAERFFAVVVGIASLMITSVLVSTITSNMVRLEEMQRSEQELESQLRTYLRSRDISERLKSHIFGFVRKTRNTRQQKAVNNREIEAMCGLPSAVGYALRREVYMPTLLHHPFFSTLFTKEGVVDRKRERELLNHVLAEHPFAMEEDLFRTGDTATRMIFLVNGEVLYKSRLDDFPNGLKVFGGEWIGEQALWLKWRMVGRAMARLPTDVVYVDSSAFQKVYAPVAYARKYAALYVKMIEKQFENMTDLLDFGDGKPKAERGPPAWVTDLVNESTTSCGIDEAPGVEKVKTSRPMLARGFTKTIGSKGN